MKNYIRTRCNQNQKSCYQMWILDKATFFDYMSFLFSILFECDKVIDTSNYSLNGKRTIGYLAELLCDFYMHYHKDSKKFLEADVCQIMYPYPKELIEPQKRCFYYYSYLIDKIKSIYAKGEKKELYLAQKRYYKMLYNLSRLLYKNKSDQLILPESE